MRRTTCVLLLSILAACSAQRLVTFEIQPLSPLPEDRRGRVVVLPFLEDGDDFDPGSEATRSLVTLLQESEIFDSVDTGSWPEELLPPPWPEGVETVEKLPEDPIYPLLEGEDPARLVELSDGGDILVLCRLRYRASSHMGFVEETRENPYSATPFRRTVRQKVTDQSVRLDLVAADGRTGMILESRDLETEQRLVQARDSIYDFFALIQPTLEEFVRALAGERMAQKRRLMR